MGEWPHACVAALYCAPETVTAFLTNWLYSKQNKKVSKSQAPGNRVAWWLPGWGGGW